MNPRLEIVSQGDEVVTGQITDTNAAWLAQQAVSLGFTVTRHTAVGDQLQDLIILLHEIAERADCCICTGGLGPTTDDLTAEAVAKAFNLPLVLDTDALAQIEQFFAHRQRVMPESNHKQALLPQGAERLDNEYGTAPGFSLQVGRCWFVFMPGVPSEMKPMYANKVQPHLAQRFSLQPSNLTTLRTLGIGESAIQELMNTITIPDNVQLGYRAELGEVQTKLLFPFAYSESEKTALVNQIATQLGDTVFAIDHTREVNSDLISVLNNLMMQGGYTLAVIETVSCGLLTSLCVGVEWLVEARYQPALIATEQADLQSLAFELQKTSGATFALVQLYAGDKNGVMILHNGLLTPQGFYSSTQTVAGALKRKQHQAAFSALDLLRRYLQQKL
ncbi:MAG: CinA family nicotinamide mononucleotide deamidase-related protein [Methylococcaceae bacterium]|nr:CinA family nicotinamide mononucleotide deamidase-related protein [Methylococcaceae bacterium]